jgi:glycosyltransferase involved in cell wall biosynthesis
MKVGLVTPGGFDRSGRERVIPVFLWLAERLARRHEVHVYTLHQSPQPDTFPLLGATIHHIGASGSARRTHRLVLRTLGLLRQEHRRGRFDVLHGLWAGESGLIAALAGRLWGVPSVVTVAGGELVALPEIGYGGQLRLKGRLVVGSTLRLAGAVTSAAEFTRQTLRQRRPDARLIALGADTCRFAPPEHPLPGPPWRLLHVASLNRVKDQPTLLRAFQQVHAAEPATHLDIIGEDTLDGAIQRLASELGLADAVTFHGFQTSDVVSAQLQSSHLLLHSSLFEDAGPLTFLEAAACAVPTVGTAVGLIADLAPEAAVAVPVGDAGALAWATLALLRDEASRAALGRRALNWATLHNADWTAAQFEALYVELTRQVSTPRNRVGSRVA